MTMSFGFWFLLDIVFGRSILILDLRALFVNLKKEEVKMEKVEARGRENISIPQGSDMITATIMEAVEEGKSRITGVNIDGLFTPIRVINAPRLIPDDKLAS